MAVAARGGVLPLLGLLLAAESLGLHLSDALGVDLIEVFIVQEINLRGCGGSLGGML